MNKFTTLRRSQICIALYAVERELLAADMHGRVRIKYGSVRDAALRSRRSQLLEALRIKDTELIAKWEKSGFPA